MMLIMTWIVISLPNLNCTTVLTLSNSDHPNPKLRRLGQLLLRLWKWKSTCECIAYLRANFAPSTPALIIFHRLSHCILHGQRQGRKFTLILLKFDRAHLMVLRIDSNVNLVVIWRSNRVSRVQVVSCLQRLSLPVRGLRNSRRYTILITVICSESFLAFATLWLTNFAQTVSTLLRTECSSITRTIVNESGCSWFFNHIFVQILTNYQLFQLNSLLCLLCTLFWIYSRLLGGHFPDETLLRFAQIIFQTTLIGCRSFLVYTCSILIIIVTCPSPGLTQHFCCQFIVKRSLNGRACIILLLGLHHMQIFVQSLMTLLGEGSFRIGATHFWIPHFSLWRRGLGFSMSHFLATFENKNTPRRIWLLRIPRCGHLFRSSFVIIWLLIVNIVPSLTTSSILLLLSTGREIKANFFRVQFASLVFNGQAFVVTRLKGTLN